MIGDAKMWRNDNVQPKICDARSMEGSLVVGVVEVCMPLSIERSSGRWDGVAIVVAFRG